MVGQVQWELIEPLDDESIYARFLAEKGKGVHHLGVAAPSFDETVAAQSSYFAPMPRRRPGTLLPLETEILELALSMLRSGQATFHGFGLAQTMREQSGSRSLTAHGTLYKTLSRLEESGLLTSR